MSNMNRRTVFTVAAGAAVAATTGAALAMPAYSELDRLLDAYKAAYAEYERLLYLSGDKEEVYLDWVKSLPAADRYFVTDAFSAVNSGEPYVLNIDMTKGLKHGLSIIDRQYSDYASGFACLDPAQGPEFQAAYDRFMADRPQHVAKCEAIKTDVRKAFTAAFEPIGKQIAALDYSAEEAACDAAVKVETVARLEVLAYRPVNDSEREAKGAWLFSQFGKGSMFAMNEAEGEALLESLYPIQSA